VLVFEGFDLVHYLEVGIGWARLVPVAREEKTMRGSLKSSTSECASSAEHPLMRMERAIWVGGVALVLGLSGTACREKAQILHGFQAKMDPSLSVAEKTALNQDAQRLLALEFRTIGRQTLPRLVFPGGEDLGTGIVKYLDERVNHIFSSSIALERVLRFGPRTSRLGALGGSLSETSDSSEPSPGQVMATNIGMAAWLMHEAAGPNDGLYARLDGEKQFATRSRIGWIQLGEAYTDARVNSIDRLETLVHEGRHSDCTGGLSQEDLLRVRFGETPANPSCGHLHAECPVGHDLAGLPACDEHPFGAYMIGAIFTATLNNQCINCTEEEKKQAKISALDSLTRIDPTLVERSLNGDFGPPDLSSQGLLENR